MPNHAISVLLAAALAAPLCLGQGVVGKPCLFNDYLAEWRTFPAILRDPAGSLSCGRYRLNLGGVTGGPAAAGTPSATSTRNPDRFGPQGHFTYRDASGNVHDLWFERYRERDRWHVALLNNGGATWAPPAAGDPGGAVFQGVFHVAYRDLQGGIQDLWFDQGWHALRLNLGDATDGPGAAGEPVQLVFGGRRHVFYRDGSGSLQHLSCDGGRWQASGIELPGVPGAAGEPAVAAVRDVLQVVYRDGAGGIQELRYDGAWHAQRLNLGGATDAPAAQGDPAAWVVDGTRLHVTYRDAAGAIQDLHRDGAWQVQRLNLGGSTGAPAAASDPVALVPPSNWEYVAYVDVQGNAQLLSHFLDQPWRSTWLNAPVSR